MGDFHFYQNIFTLTQVGLFGTFSNFEKWYLRSAMHQKSKNSSVPGPHHDPDGVRHLIEDMWGLWGDGRHAAAPQHRVQPRLVDGVEGEFDVVLGEVTERNLTQSGTASSINPCVSNLTTPALHVCAFVPDFLSASLVVSKQQPVDAVLTETLRTVFVYWGLDETRRQLSHLSSVLIWSPHHLHVTQNNTQCTWAEIMFARNMLRINDQTSLCRELYIPVHLPGSEELQIAAQPAVYRWSSCGSRGAPEEVFSAWKPLCCYGKKPASEAAPGCTHSGCQSGPAHEGTGCVPSKRGQPETQEHDVRRMNIITCLLINYCIVIAFLLYKTIHEPIRCVE